MSSAPAGEAPASTETRRLLFVAPGFLSYRVHKHVRGVQVFDVQLIRQLVAEGIHITVLAESSWKPRMRELLGDLTGAARARATGAAKVAGKETGGLEIIYTPTLFKPLWNGIVAAVWLKLTGRRWECAYISNCGEGLATAVNLMARLGIFKRLVLMSHRIPRKGWLELVKRYPSRSLTVHEHIRAYFPQDVERPCVVRFGEIDHAVFFPASPAETAARRGDGLVHFVILGALDTPIKDVPTAVRAFELLPAGVRKRCRLHLASFAKPPRDLPEGVIAYPWMPIGKVPGFLRKMDAMLVTSTTETFCLALVQGMLTGLPSVVRDIPTLSEKVDTGGGVVFSDAETLSAHMATLVRDVGLRERMGAIARRTALERYTWDTPGFVREFLFPG